MADWSNDTDWSNEDDWSSIGGIEEEVVDLTSVVVIIGSGVW
jgi:hypothetical protein